MSEISDKICILGSINLDIVLKVDSIPQVGETVLGNDLKKYPGGKGANQASAAGKLDGNVYMIGKVGNDENGKLLVKQLIDNNVKTEYVSVDDENPTGIAIINVNKEGNNSIVVVSGSNMAVSGKQIDDASELIKSSKVIVSQFEIPIDTILKGFKLAKENGVITILNPAPAKKIPCELLKYTDIIVPNETEVESITGVKVNDEKSAVEASKYFFCHGVKYVIITLGENGSVLISKDRYEKCKAYKVKAVDTTSAGDCFIGAMAAEICRYEKPGFDDILNCMKFGNKASSICVQRSGAQTSLPYRNEVC